MRQCHPPLQPSWQKSDQTKHDATSNNGGISVFCQKENRFLVFLQWTRSMLNATLQLSRLKIGQKYIHTPTEFAVLEGNQFSERTRKVLVSFVQGSGYSELLCSHKVVLALRTS